MYSPSAGRMNIHEGNMNYVSDTKSKPVFAQFVV